MPLWHASVTRVTHVPTEIAGAASASKLLPSAPDMKTVTTKAWLRRDERGQGLAEYAIAIGVITVAVIVAVQLVGSRIVPLWNSAAANIQSAAG